MLVKVRHTLQPGSESAFLSHVSVFEHVFEDVGQGFKTHRRRDDRWPCRKILSSIRPTPIGSTTGHSSLSLSSPGRRNAT